MFCVRGKGGPIAVACLCLLPPVQAATRANAGRKTPPAPKATANALKTDDVVATVEGQPITRQELTYFWLKADARAASLLGGLLADRWTANRGASPGYTVSEAEIYQRLYADPNRGYVAMLSNLITTKLAAVEARRKGILVTPTQGWAKAHEMFDQVRMQQNSNLSDEEMIKTYRLPRDIFLNDMMFRVRAEKLLAAEIARRNGHPIGPEDWGVIRELFVGVTPVSDAGDTERKFSEAKQRIEGWAQEVKGGRRMEDVAREHNENFTRAQGGLRGVCLRGTGSPELEKAIFALKPGEMSAPLRSRNGWYVFTLERRGNEISEQERSLAWKQIVEARLPAYLSDLRKRAKITSIYPLPVETPPAAVPIAPGDADMPPPPPVTQ
jgi:hypothetical protein